MFPCFDAPGVKVPYSAAVHSPDWSTVLMSALACTDNPIPNVISSLVRPLSANKLPNNFKTYYWYQPLPVSSYLIALAAGKLSSIDVSPRVRVWAEPEVVKQAAWEFDQTG